MFLNHLSINRYNLLKINTTALFHKFNIFINQNYAVSFVNITIHMYKMGTLCLYVTSSYVKPKRTAKVNTFKFFILLVHNMTKVGVQADNQKRSNLCTVPWLNSSTVLSGR